ncbi:hemolysin family protein [Thalassoglobus sp. JC818]|uniref:hemolysin family protein n=1 Tax=Thalassoglobus sp. JC818 TaxID=3232136 RepID=UPI00345B3EFE
MMSLLVFYALLAIGFSFFCSVAEAVLLSVTPSYIATLKEQGKSSALLLEKLKANVDRPLAAILSLNTVAHTVGAAGVGAQAAEIWGMETGGGHAVGWASAVMTLAILVLSEIIPKTLGAVYWRSLAAPIAMLTNWLIWILYPLVLLSEVLTRLIAGSDRQEIVTRAEVAAMAAISAQGGHIDPSESRILANLFKLQKLTAEDVMTPRTVIRAFPESMTVAEVLAKHPNLSVSRIPIYEGSIDGITGFVLKSEILLAQANDQPETPLSKLKRPLRSVSATTQLSELFDLLLNERSQIAIVVDQFGGTDGLVTMEDVIETLLGMEIVDEMDRTDDMQRLARKQWEKRAKEMGLDAEPITAKPTPETDDHSK